MVVVNLISQSYLTVTRSDCFQIGNSRVDKAKLTIAIDDLQSKSHTLSLFLDYWPHNFYSCAIYWHIWRIFLHHKSKISAL